MGSNTDLLARARKNLKQAKEQGRNPFHSLQNAALTCDMCNLQTGVAVAVVGYSWSSGWLYVCDACAQGDYVSSAGWIVRKS